MFSKFTKKFKSIFNKKRGQTVVEYGLILVLSVMLGTVIFNTQQSTENYLHTISDREATQNPRIVATPDEPSPDVAWDNRFNTENRTNPIKPVAYFTAPNPVYVGEKVTYWDASYSPSGVIVERTWEGKRDVFNSPGEYRVTLTVRDNNDLTDSYSVVIKVKQRDEYTRLEYDHKNETRVELGRTPVYNVGSEKSRIIEHTYGRRTDRYGIEHVVIEKNYWQYTQERAVDITYEVTIPIIEVTYYGDGRVKSVKPHMQGGKQATVIHIDTETKPQPSLTRVGHKSGGSVYPTPIDNRWTFFIYDQISSVKNPSNSWVSNPNNTWGSRSPSVDSGSYGTRFDPEVEQTTQNPEFYSTRSTKILPQYNPGWNIPSSKCPTCTEPNRFTRQSQHINDYRTVRGCGGRSWSKITHTRTHNWIEHESYDWVYKYTGVGESQGNAPNGELIKIRRNSWTTQGWQPAEQVGGNSSNPSQQRTDISNRPKYTDCQGDGWSESCWQPESNSDSANDSWDTYDTVSWAESRGVSCNCRTETVCTGEGENIQCSTIIVCDTCIERRSCTMYYDRRREWSCSWYGTDVTYDDWTYGYRTRTSCGSWS